MAMNKKLSILVLEETFSRVNWPIKASYSSTFVLKSQIEIASIYVVACNSGEELEQVAKMDWYGNMQILRRQIKIWSSFLDTYSPPQKCYRI